MKNKIVFFSTLFVIFLLGAVLRFYQLSTNPPGIYVDEAAIGYNAFSILKTNRDEYGKFLPIFFRSFGDYKMPVYIYFSVLPVKIFGLNPFSVRFLSALSGSILILIVYFLSLYFVKNHYLALINAFFFSITPWVVFSSRAAFEANLALFFLLSALWCSLFSLKNRRFPLFLLSIFLYGLSAYTYHSERIISPLLLMAVVILQKPDFGKHNFLKIFFSTILFFLILFPQVRLSFSVAGQSRLQSLKDSSKNKTTQKIRNYFSLYSAYFSPRNLFFDPDPDKQRSYPDLSVFYSWMMIPFFTGLYFLSRKKVTMEVKAKEFFFGSVLAAELNLSNNKLLLILLVLLPIPASFTGDPFSALRALPLVFPLLLIISLGTYIILRSVAKTYFRIMILFCLTSVSFLELFRAGFVMLPAKRNLYWNYGYQQLSENIVFHRPEKVLVDDPQGVSYIQLLFFQQYQPKDYQRTGSISLSNYYDIQNWDKEHVWDNIEVRALNWKRDVYQEKLIVASPIAISENQAKEHFLEKTFSVTGFEGEVIFNGFLTHPDLKLIDDKLKLEENYESGNI